jgi:hypothetical protein
MKTRMVEFEEFFATVKNLKWQNQDIKESWDLGYKSPYDAFDKANTAWARFYLIEDEGVVLSAILEQRDGTLIYFTTKALQGANLRKYLREMIALSDKVIECRDVLFVTVASWYIEARKFLRAAGFRRYHIESRYEVWGKDGK